MITAGAPVQLQEKLLSVRDRDSPYRGGDLTPHLCFNHLFEPFYLAAEARKYSHNRL